MQNPKSILITGASSGLGKALALAYSQDRVTLYLTGRNTERLAEVVELCRSKGADVHFSAIDVVDAEALKIWILECDEKNPIDLVIANAGISNAGQTVSMAFNQKIFDVNLQGVLNTIHPIIPRMQSRQCGHIALMSSLSGFRGMARSPAYSASKAAVKSYGDALGGLLYCRRN